MPLRKLALGAILLGAVSLCSYAVGQQNAQPDDVQSFEKELEEARDSLGTGRWTEIQPGARKMTSLTEKAVGNRAYSQSLVSQAMARYYSDGDSKAQIRLQALQVAQNQRIIELLEKVADR